MSAPTPVQENHRARLTRDFALDVAALAPRSLLDVGCGGGLLLSELSHLGVPLQGIEPGEHRVAQARDRGLEVRQADACALPFENAAFDWVVIRHVLHHLDDPGLAIGEAWRCARAGVVLAEPTSDLDVASQRVMARFDELTTKLMARAGHVHHPYLSAERLIANVPDTPRKTETRTYAAPTPVPPAEVRAIGELASGGVPLDAEEAAQLESFVRAAGAGELTFNGSVAVFVQR